MTKQIHSLLLMLLMLAVSSAAYALDDNERTHEKTAGFNQLKLDIESMYDLLLKK